MNKIIFILLNAVVWGTSAATATPGKAPEAGRGPASLTQNFTAGANTVEVTVSFETVQNLSVVNLGASAITLLPVIDPLLLARLPASVSIPVAFPVKVNIDPPPTPLVGLEFTGVASVILDTANLPYTPGTRLRLFSAHALGDFVDITEEVSEGSYRVRGSQGEFSEFLIVTDDRDPASIVTTKFSRLNTLMTTHQSAIDTTVFANLSADLSSAETNWLVQNIDDAKADIQSFIATAVAATAVELPDVWKSIGGVDNIDGLLRAAAGTLHFSLEDARDTDADGVYDYADNCIAEINVSQCDTNSDGFGNHCDADLDNNGIINSFDLTIMRTAFGATGSNDADLDCNGVVNSFDLTIMRESFGSAPGPAAP